MAGRDRTRLLVRGLATSLLGRGLALIAPLILIPVLYRHFGTIQYGLYATVVSLTSMFVWADLGLGNGLLTKLSVALARDDRRHGRELISSAYSTLFVIAGAAVLLLFASTIVVPWAEVLGLESANNVGLTVVICFGLLFVNVPLSLIQRVQFASQQVAQSNLFQMASPVTALAAALAGVGMGWSYSLVLALISLGPIVSSLLASAWFYSRNRDLLPAITAPWGPVGRALLRLGGAFLVVQMLSALAMNLDNLLVAHLTGAKELANFSVTVRLFLLLGGVVTVTMLPLWPANTEALARGDVEWVRRTTSRMMVGGAAAILSAGTLITAVGPSILPLVLGSSFEASVPLMLGLTVQWAAIAAAAPLFMIQNAVGFLRAQLVAWPVFLVASVAAKLVTAGTLGFDWVPAVGALLYLIIVVTAGLIGAGRVLRAEECKRL